jgi:hypothetical protein
MSKFLSEQAGVEVKTRWWKINSYVSRTRASCDEYSGHSRVFGSTWRKTLQKLQSPVLVASRTEWQQGQLAAKYDAVRIDLMAMSVNDMLVQGASLVFLVISPCISSAGCNRRNGQRRCGECAVVLPCWAARQRRCDAYREGVSVWQFA